MYLLEQLDRVLADDDRQDLDGVLEVRQAALLGLVVPLFGVAVAVEDDLLVLLDDLREQVLDRVVEVLAALDGGFELGGDVVERLGDDRVQDRVGAGDVGRAADGAELELVAGEGERDWCGCGRRLPSGSGGRTLTPVWNMPPCLLRLGAALFDLLEDVVELVAEEDRDDRRRGLVGAEAVVVVGRRDRQAEDLAVLGDGADDGGA